MFLKIGSVRLNPDHIICVEDHDVIVWVITAEVQEPIAEGSVAYSRIHVFEGIEAAALLAYLDNNGTVDVVRAAQE